MMRKRLYGIRWPVVASARELDPGPRRFLYFTVFNVVSWQCTVGQVLVLFGRRIDMPASWVGFLIAFMPLSMLLVVFTGALIQRYGSKPVVSVSWFLRNLFACTVFAMPWAVRHGGPRAAWYVLMASTFGFCLMRSIGGGGWWPWLHELIPESQRGAYFSAEAAVSQCLNVVVAITQALLLFGSPDLHRYLLIYSIGIISGFVSLVWLGRVPGGLPNPDARQRRSLRETYVVSLADTSFLRFVAVVALCYATLSWTGSALTLYMRDALHVSPKTIMVYAALGSVGIMFTARFWARFAEFAGSRSAMTLSLAAHGGASLAVLLLLPGAGWTLWALPFLILAVNIFNAAYCITASRAMLSYVKPFARVGYTNLWTVGTALALGLTPILAGQIIHGWNLWGYRACFFLAGLGGLVCAAVVRRTVPEHPRVQSGGAPSFRLRQHAAAVGRIVTITLGLHESNRRTVP